MSLFLFLAVAMALNPAMARAAEPDALNLPTQINNVYLVGIGLIGFVALAGIIIGGFQYVASAGNAERASHAKTTIVASISGLMLALLSVFILNIFSPQFTTFSGDWFLNKADLSGKIVASQAECVSAGYTCGAVRHSNGQYECLKNEICADAGSSSGPTPGTAGFGAKCYTNPGANEPRDSVCKTGLTCIFTGVEDQQQRDGRCDNTSCIAKDVQCPDGATGYGCCQFGSGKDSSTPAIKCAPIASTTINRCVISGGV